MSEQTQRTETETEPVRRVDVAVAIVFDEPRQRVLICKRKADAVLGGFWEFPGGKCNEGETPRDCAIREVREEVGVEVDVEGPLAVIEHAYPHGLIRLHPFLCRHAGGVPQCLAVADLQWVDPKDLAQFKFPPANASLIEAVTAGFAALAEAQAA